MQKGTLNKAIHNNTLNQIISSAKDITFRLDKLKGNQGPI